ncbi:hypothetical protein SAMN05216464_12710 [Mucilaginibacter pineti]|uniref:Uncharacterized protein n=1 Tax=Mucilaginibacter pineti TaxID=1391627 RepID=A0A1G7NIR5_9SPHI|nr:hypothetical protein [Mucilaginibacter pineti]SDF73160.1 hypothetical protein SAMN05216464_12710 [Mucilaginibacter pineti]
MNNTVKLNSADRRQYGSKALSALWKQLTCILAAGLFGIGQAVACDACQKQQPKLFQGITHGAGPSSNWDYVIVAVMTIVTLYTLYATVKRIVRPAEKETNHIKNMIFNQ